MSILSRHSVPRGCARLIEYVGARLDGPERIPIPPRLEPVRCVQALATILALAGVCWVSRSRPVSSRSAWSMQTRRRTTAGDAEEIALVQAIAKKAGLEPFSSSHDRALPGLGDADARFRTDALERCESLAPAFIQHFNGKGFKLALPKTRLTVITLKDAESYQAFTRRRSRARTSAATTISTPIVWSCSTFDPTDEGPAVVNDPERVNLLTLVHETTHLLCFNTGLLSRRVECARLGQRRVGDVCRALAKQADADR